jgi:lipopolysaccharide export system protein LptA
MPLQASRVRRWFAMGAVAMVAIVLGTYYYAKWRVDSTLQQVKEKIGVEIKQSAQGFTISKSVAGRTLFKIQASKAVQYRQGEHAELHEVNITLYGDDSSRFDQIYGQDFEYNPQSGDVSAKGDVQIDLQANPEGLTHADQALPKELKNPIHLKTSGLVFNQKTGNAYTKEKIIFRIPQAQGSAQGATYESKSGVLTLQSEVTAEFHGTNPAKVTAASATITKQPEVIVLQKPRGQSGTEKFEAEEVKFFLRPDNTLDHAIATGQVFAESRGEQPLQVRSQQLEVKMMEETASVNVAKFSGDVRWETLGEQPMKGHSGVMQLDFAGQNFPRKIHTEQAVELSQQQDASQSFNLTAPGMDLFLAKKHLERAETLGAGKIVITDSSSQQTRATAGKFEAKFNAKGRFATLHGSPDARIESGDDRVSTSQNLDVVFAEKGGVQSITQQGSVAYSDGTLKATGEQAVYSTTDQTVLLTGSPRVVSGGMTTTADTMKVNRKTGDMSAEGNVKSTYSDLKPQPNGALLASADPIHVTARSVVAHKEPGAAVYTGGVRLWQQANVVEAPSVEFDRNHRSVQAHASGTKKVTTTLIQAGGKGQTKPLTIVSGSLTYKDDDSKVHFGDGVVGRVDDIVLTAEQMDAFREASADSSPKIDRIVAQNHVLITQPGRKATGELLIYTAADDKFVLSGGFPSIFDAERGKITGVSLTFFRRDARVLVEGSNASPAVSQTQVAR